MAKKIFFVFNKCKKGFFMKLNNLLPTLLLAATPVFTTCSKKASHYTPQLINDLKLQTILADTFSTKMSDMAKVVEFNKLLKQYGKSNGNYIVIDKKHCKAMVINPDGDILQTHEVALGKHIGDKRGGGYGVKGAKLAAYTPPGEFTICKVGSNKGSSNERLYDQRVLVLAGDHTQKAYQRSQVLALHRVPRSPMGKLRENVLKNKSIKDNRVSFGCVNFLVDSFDKMKSMIKGVSTKVYILPEEKGNSLYLEKQSNGTFKFFQKKYRYESQEKY